MRTDKTTDPDIQTYRQTDRQKDRPIKTDRQKDTQPDRQTDLLTHTGKDRQTE